MDWRLYVDESGTFQGRDADLRQRVVAGVLVRDGTKAANEKRLLELFDTHAPWIPWPPHANLITKAVCHALWALPWAPTASKRKRQKADIAIRASEMLLAAAPDRTRALAQQLQRVPKADHQLIAHLDKALLDRDRTVHAELTRLARTTRTKVTEEVGKLAAERTDDGVPAIALAVAGEAAQGESPASILPGRYLPLLELLLERVADALTARGEERHRVELHILGRHVEDSAHGEDLPLDRGHVDQVVDQVTGGGLERSARGVTVEFAITDPHTFDRDTLAHLVLADFAANAALRPLNDVSGLARVQGWVETEVGLPAALGAGTPTNLAGGGDARRWVQLARGGAQAPTASGPGRRWAFEQADAWCRVVSAWQS